MHFTGGNPIFGSIGNIIKQTKMLPFTQEKDIFSLFTQWAQEEPFASAGVIRLSRMAVHTTSRVILLDADHVVHLLNFRNQKDFVKGRSYKVAEPLIGNGLLNSVGRKALGFCLSFFA